MDLLYEAAARAGFNEEVVQKIRDMSLDEEELRTLTREDVNSEFTDLKFPQRKKLWLIFEEQKRHIRTPAAHQDHPEPPRYDDHETDNPNEVPPQPADPHPDACPPSYGSPPDSYDDSGNGDVHVNNATGSNVAGGNITSTTYNAPKEYSKYRIEMDDAKGVALGDHSSVQENEFN